MDRSKFKASTLNSIKDEQGKAEKAIPSTNSSGGRAGFLKTEDGDNFRRIAPAHNPDEPPYRAKSTTFLECEVNEIDDDGKETGKTEVKLKNIFIATQHSKIVKEDPILTYISYVQKKAYDEIQDKDERQKFLYPINGWRGKDGKWNWGIRPDIRFVFYAWDESGTLGRDEVSSKMLDDMKKISVQQADNDAEIIPDIFSDPDEGYPLIISKVKNDKGKWEYNVSCELPSKAQRETWQQFFDRVRVTDEQLTELISKESLKELYEDVYTSRDFEMAVDGLQRFDIKHKYGIFQNDEFLAKLEEIQKTVPTYTRNDEQTEKSATEKSSPKSEKPVQETPKQEAPKSDFKAYPPIPAMKNAIKAYITENYGVDYSIPDLTRDDITKWYDLTKAGEELPFEDYQGMTTDSQPVESITKEIEQPKPEPVNTPKEEKTSSKPEVVDSTADSGIDPEVAAQIAALRKRRSGAQ